MLRDSPPILPVKEETAEELLYWGGRPGEWTAVRTSEGVIYTPVTDGWAVGFRATFEDGRPDEYVYLNPSNANSREGSDVFVYHGPDGDPSSDGSVIYVAIGQDD